MGLFQNLLWWRRSPVDDLQAIVMDSTSVCNLRCTICSLDRFYENKGIMSLATFERLRPVFRRLLHIALSNSAEPLLNPNLVEMVRIAKSDSEGRLAVSITTNGTLLTDRLGRDLIAAGVDGFQVSIDGATKETFESIRRGACFEEVVDNTRRMAVIRSEMGRENPHLSIRFVLQRANMRELTALLDLAASIGVDHVVVNGYEPYDPEATADVLYGREPPAEAVAVLADAQQRADALGVRLDLPTLSPLTFDECILVSNTCHVLWDGTVVPCSPLGYERPYYYLSEPVPRGRLSFGNVNDTPLKRIWRLPEYRRFRRDMREHRLGDFCPKCLYRAGVLTTLEPYRWLREKQEEASGQM